MGGRHGTERTSSQPGTSTTSPSSGVRPVSPRRRSVDGHSPASRLSKADLPSRLGWPQRLTGSPPDPTVSQVLPAPREYRSGSTPRLSLDRHSAHLVTAAPR